MLIFAQNPNHLKCFKTHTHREAMKAGKQKIRKQEAKQVKWTVTELIEPRSTNVGSQDIRPGETVFWRRCAGFASNPFWYPPATARVAFLLPNIWLRHFQTPALLRWGTEIGLFSMSWFYGSMHMQDKLLPRNTSTNISQVMPLAVCSRIHFV